MIFYFSGTGNCIYCAKKISNVLRNASLLNIASENKRPIPHSYVLHQDEILAFVFPVYYYGVPNVVLDFVSHMLISGKPKKVVAIACCGGDAAAADKMFKKTTSSIGIIVDTFYEVKTPDNYVLMYQPDTSDKLNVTDKRLKDVIEDIKDDSVPKARYKSNIFDSIKTFVLYHFYKKGRKTRKFYATSSCNSCGLCEKICPVNAIKLVDGKPYWSKSQCAQCLGCINRCPKKSIQYGKGTLKRSRYVNPYA